MWNPQSLYYNYGGLSYLWQGASRERRRYYDQIPINVHWLFRAVVDGRTRLNGFRRRPGFDGGSTPVRPYQSDRVVQVRLEVLGEKEAHRREVIQCICESNEGRVAENLVETQSPEFCFVFIQQIRIIQLYRNRLWDRLTFNFVSPTFNHFCVKSLFAIYNKHIL